MEKTRGSYPEAAVGAAGTGVASHAGLLLGVEAVRALGLDGALSEASEPWREPLAFHDPGKIVTDLALSLVAGGECLADVALVRTEPGLFGPVASDPKVSRLVDTLAADAPRSLAAINTARAAVRPRAWAAAGTTSPAHGASALDPVVMDVDATLVTAHSEKEQAAPTPSRGFGFHPLRVFVDRRTGGTGKPLAVLLRKGNAVLADAGDRARPTTPREQCRPRARCLRRR